MGTEDDIRQAESELNTLRPQLYDATQAFIAAAVPFAQTWVRQKAREGVTSDPQRSQAIGVEAIQALRRQVDALVESIPGEVQEAFSSQAVWPHFEVALGRRWGVDENWEPSRSGRMVPERAQEPFRDLFGQLGALLEEAGVCTVALSVSSPGRYGWTRGTSNAPVRWGGSLEFDEELTSATNAYADLWMQYRKKKSSLQALEKRLAEEQVTEIWGAD